MRAPHRLATPTCPLCSVLCFAVVGDAHGMRLGPGAAYLHVLSVESCGRGARLWLGRVRCARSFIGTWNDILSCCACIHVRPGAHLAPVAHEHPAPGVRASLHHSHIVSRASNMQLRTHMRAQLRPCAPPSAHTHARVLCLPQYRPFLVRILEPGGDLGVYHHLIA